MELRKLHSVVERILQRHRGNPYQLEITMNPKPMGDYIEMTFTLRKEGGMERGFFQITNTMLAEMTPLQLHNLMDAKVKGMLNVRGYERPMQTQEVKDVKPKSPVEEWLQDYDRRDTTTNG